VQVAFLAHRLARRPAGRLERRRAMVRVPTYPELTDTAVAQLVPALAAATATAPRYDRRPCRPT
jgi:hypothetical protein